MGTFQKLCLIIAIIILIIVLLFIAISIKTRKEQWPPVIGDCPDYWIDLSGNGKRCLNVKDLGNTNIKSVSRVSSVPNVADHMMMDFSIPPFTGTGGLCSKYTWAQNNNVTWDGITYGVSNPCNI